MDGLLELGLWIIFGLAWKTRSPLVGGVLAGIFGAIGGAAVLGLCGHELGVLTPAGSDLWFESAVVGAALIGYPLGAFGGILIVGRRRGQTGSAWLALLGALVGTGLGVGLYQGNELAGPLLSDLAPWAGWLVMLVPIVLIPTLAWQGYGWGPALKGVELPQQLTPGREIIRQDRPAMVQVGAASEQQHQRVEGGTQSTGCPNCNAANPAGSAFCSECGAPYLVAKR
jgi:hypothetical protein